MEPSTKTDDLDEAKRSAQSPSIGMPVRGEGACISSPTISAPNKEKKETSLLNANARIFIPRAMQAQDKPEQANPRYVYNPYNIMQTTYCAGLDYIYQPYGIFESTHRMGMSWIPGRTPFRMQAREVGLGGCGVRIGGSDRNEIEKAKYSAKHNMQYFEGREIRAGVKGCKQHAGQQNDEEKKPELERPRTRAEAGVPTKAAKKGREQGEDGMASKARRRKAVRERKKAEEALAERARAAAGEEEAATRGCPEILEE